MYLDVRYVRSDEVAARTFLFLLYDRLHLFLKNDSHSLVEDSLESLLSESTAFHVLAFELIFDHLPGRFFEDWGILRVLLHY